MTKHGVITEAQYKDYVRKKIDNDRFLTEIAPRCFEILSIILPYYQTTYGGDIRKYQLVKGNFEITNIEGEWIYCRKAYEEEESIFETKYLTMTDDEIRADLERERLEQERITQIKKEESEKKGKEQRLQYYLKLKEEFEPQWKGWKCEKSPTGRCDYDTVKDPACDECIYCGEPSERK